MIKQLFEKYQTDKTKYSRFYQYWLSQKNFLNILEIGAYKGGSLRAWREFFPSARIWGIESDQKLRDESPDLNIFVGDQKDQGFLREVIRTIGIPDLIIDDGGHKMSQQITSFKTLFPLLQSGGYYIIEDLETSYLPDWHDQPLTTIEFLTTLVNHVNFTGNSHSGENGVQDMLSRGLEPSEWSKSIESMTFSNNICLIKKI